MLALMEAALTLEPDTPLPKNLRDLKEVQIARMTLVRDRIRLKNRLQTLTLTFPLKQAKVRLALASRQLHDIDAEIAACMAQDGATAHKRHSLTSIPSIGPGIGPGIGPVTAAAILMECPEVGTMTGNQVASLSGLAPMTRQSVKWTGKWTGNWTGKSFILGGRKPLRDALCLPAPVAAPVAARFNPDLKRIHQVMIAVGKPKKIALTALMRTLIELANTLIQNDRKWVPKPA